MPQLKAVPYISEKLGNAPTNKENSVEVPQEQEKPLTGTEETKSSNEQVETGESTKNDKAASPAKPARPVPTKEVWDISFQDLDKWHDPDDREDPNDVADGFEGDGQWRDAGTISRLQHEKDMRKQWRYAYKVTAK